jgi:hypothetical protein
MIKNKIEIKKRSKNETSLPVDLAKPSGAMAEVHRVAKSPDLARLPRRRRPFNRGKNARWSCPTKTRNSHSDHRRSQRKSKNRRIPGRLHPALGGGINVMNGKLMHPAVTGGTA